jgi:hypothetical protein
MSKKISNDEFLIVLKDLIQNPKNSGMVKFSIDRVFLSFHSPNHSISFNGFTLSNPAIRLTSFEDYLELWILDSPGTKGHIGFNILEGNITPINNKEFNIFLPDLEINMVLSFI